MQLSGNGAASKSVGWPDMSFGPVNLWSLPSAFWFYLTSEEKEELIMAAQHEENV